MGSLRPLNDKVIVRRLEADAKTAGGILLPEQAKEKPRQGVIEAVGEGRLLDDGRRVPLQVKPGHRVLFASYAGTEIKVDGDDLLVLGEEDVLATLD
ncbi:MAG: co-chaperone GroES [Planctomycetes bacterium]|nr:co-chaperone GroES [Planctomycetota bacterium]